MFITDVNTLYYSGSYTALFCFKKKSYTALLISLQWTLETNQSIHKKLSDVKFSAFQDTPLTSYNFF